MPRENAALLLQKYFGKTWPLEHSRETHCEACGSGAARAESSSQVRLSQRHPVLLTPVVGTQHPEEMLGRWAGVVTGKNTVMLQHGVPCSGCPR